MAFEHSLSNGVEKMSFVFFVGMLPIVLAFDWYYLKDLSSIAIVDFQLLLLFGIRLMLRYVWVNETIEVELMSDDAILPTRAYDGDAGWDVYAVEDVSISPGDVARIRTGVRCKSPKQTYLRMADKSGISLYHNVRVVAGVIDSGYTGEISAILHNFGTKTAVFKKGLPVAQMICTCIEPVKLYQTHIDRVKKCCDSLRDNRQDKGFGSTYLTVQQKLSLDNALEEYSDNECFSAGDDLKPVIDSKDKWPSKP